jgi:ubiquinol-cytochrome c reductase cytochrome b subunit
LFGGYISIDRSGNGSFKWYITKKEDILNLIEYFKKYPSRSTKNKKLHLIPKFYELKNMEAHTSHPESLLSKSWNTFISKWNNYE